VTFVYIVSPLVYKPSFVNTNEGIEQDIPVGDGALVIIIAWQLSIERAHTDAHDTVFVREDNLARVILGATVQVVACSTKIDWNAHTHAKGSIIRVHFLADTWALVAHSKVEVIVLATRCSIIARARDAAALIAIATARYQGFLMKVMA
jgi:hypothetical protein